MDRSKKKLPTKKMMVEPDSDDNLDDDLKKKTSVIKKKEKKTNKGNKKILLNIDDYEVKSWNQVFPDYKVQLKNMHVERSWKDLINSEMDKDYFGKINDFLELSLEKTEGKVKMYPYPNLVFSAFNRTSMDSVKVVILGQDPYFNNEIHNDACIPQAMGLSFSVPVGINVPSSLKNIFSNMEKFGHLKTKPKHGNLSSWADQGVMMLNTALTVQHGYANSHGSKWQLFTDTVIKYISDNKDHIAFVLWGAPALKKLDLIDTTKHKAIISSHPSGLSCRSTLRTYPAFMDFDHFGEINSYLRGNKKCPIEWE